MVPPMQTILQSLNLPYYTFKEYFKDYYNTNFEESSIMTKNLYGHKVSEGAFESNCTKVDAPKIINLTP